MEAKAGVLRECRHTDSEQNSMQAVPDDGSTDCTEVRHHSTATFRRLRRVAALERPRGCAQEALDAPRFKVEVEGNQDVMVEEDLSPDVVKELEKRGHTVNVVSGYDRASFGGGQVISRDPESAVLTAGSEPRKDGSAVGY